MDTDTGRIYEVTAEAAKKMSEGRHKMVEVKRNLTEKERMEKQIALYSPCACGSGVKFKFCCRTAQVAEAALARAASLIDG